MKRAIALSLLLAGCDAKPSYSHAEIESHVMLDGAPAGFWLGTATAAHQIEGGLDNDWTAWEASGGGFGGAGTPHIKNHDTARVAADSWNRWREDLAAMQSLGVNTYRMSIEWSRLQHAAGAALDASAVARYRQQLQALRDAHIRPVVTLSHFSLPTWAGEDGKRGWDSDQTAGQLADFAGKAATAFGDLVDEWITLNEMNVVAVNGWSRGSFPPGKLDDNVGMAHAIEQQLKAHAQMVKLLRQNDTVDADGDGRATFIGIAHHVRIFEPATGSALDQLVTGLTDDFFNAAIPNALTTGRIVLNVPGAVAIDEAVDGLAGSVDFFGLNYYTRDYVRADLTKSALSFSFTPMDRQTNTLGWEVVAEGLERSLVRFGRYGLPIVITENGTTLDSDADRAFFIRAHLFALDRARGEGVDVRGYLHWSLLDNFEWAEGYTAHFGLFSVTGEGTPDAPLTRVPRPLSVATFQEAAHTLGLR